MSKSVSQKLSNFVCNLKYEDIPANVLEKAKINFLHGLCVGLASVNLEFGKIALNAVLTTGEGEIPDGATLLMNGGKSTTMGAAFANGVLFHGRTQEDTHGTTHCGPTIIPPAMAVAETIGCDGKKFLTALVAGYEVAAAIGKNHTALSTPRGFRATSIYGIFGATAAVLKLLELSEDETVNALGYAASFAFGTTETFAAGTMEWRFEAGLAGRNGILAALLAKSGAVAASTAMEGKAGFFHAFTGSIENLEVVTEHLGLNWEILNVDLKPYPVCAFNQTPVTAMLKLVKENNILPAQVEKITIKMTPYEVNYPGMSVKTSLRTIGGTLMSTPFCLALACAERDVTLAGLQKYDDPAINDLLEKVTMEADPERKPLCCRIDLVTVDGKVYTEEMNISPGMYRYTWEQDVALVKGMQGDMKISPEQLDSLINLIKDVEQIANVADLVKLAIA